MKSYINAIVFSLAIVLSAMFLSGAWKKSHPTHESITVTGLANENFTSDVIVWDGWFTEKEMELKDAYSKVKRDAEIVRQYLLSKGVKPEEIVFGSVSINKKMKMVFSSDNKTHEEIFDGYELTQTVKIQSIEVDKIEQISREVTELINQDVELYSMQPSYYYTKLSDLKIRMLAAATADARNRAEKIAQNSGSKLGKLQNATMGIFQITGQNSNEEFSGGGAFNTSSKAKTASITVRLEFTVD
jgi:hypothetical protein